MIFFFFFVLGELEAKQKWWRTFGLNHWCGMISYHTSLQSSLIFFCLIGKIYSFLRRLVVDCSFYPNSVFDKHAPKFRVWYVVLIFQAIRAWCDIKLFSLFIFDWLVTLKWLVQLELGENILPKWLNIVFIQSITQYARQCISV